MNSNYFQKEDPNIILLNSTGIPDEDRIRIFMYNVYQKNKDSEENDGVAIAIKRNINHQLIDDFASNLSAVKIDTSKGPLIVATTYNPPRKEHKFPTEDINKIMRKNIQVIMIADLNARERFNGYQRGNNSGKIIKNLLDRDIVHHLGPDFNTMFNRDTQNAKPDIILTNRRFIMNIEIKQGMITSSDHFPIVTKISTRPIIKEFKPILVFRKANWSRFKEKTKEEIIVTNDMVNLTEDRRNKIDKNKIDGAIEKWMLSVTNGVKASIPEKKNNLPPSPKR